MHAAWDGARIAGLQIASSRPHVADRLLAERTLAEAVAIVPRLYSICGRSQAVAAALACEAASGHACGAATQAARQRLIEGEIVQEYLWRVLLDWPPRTEAAPQPLALVAARRAIQSWLAPDEDAACYGASAEGRDPLPPEVLRAVAREHVLGTGTSWNALDDLSLGSQWLDRRATAPAALIAGLLDARPALGASEVALLPADGSAVARGIDPALAGDPGFARAPTWQGAPAETGALVRARARPLVARILAQSGRSVVARLLARVAELVALLRPDRPARAPLCGAVVAAPGRGLGWVETARGLLVHAVESAGGRVRRYAIVAPTEWNFHPRGALPAGLAGAAAAAESEVARLVGLTAQSLDPCVALRVEVARV